MKKIQPLYSLILILAVIITACSPAASEPTAAPPDTQTPPPAENPTSAPADDWAVVQASGVLRVGTAADYPPFSFFDSTGQMDGFDIALIVELAKRLALTPEITDFAFDGLLDAQALYQVDVSIAALSITLDRMNQVDFTNLYFIGVDGILARLDSPIISVKSPADMAGQRVAVQRGSVYEDWVKENLVEPGIITPDQLFSYDTTENAVRDLKESRVDLVLMDLLPAKKATESGVKLVGQGLFPQQFAMALRKGSTLTAELNRVLAEAQADGTVNALIETYLKFDTEATIVTPPPPAPTPVFLTPVPPACIYGMAFVADLSYPDYNMTSPPVLQAGQTFTKSWRIRNTGTCSWDPSFFLRYVRGNVPAAQMNGQPVPVPAVIAPGATVDMSVNLIAPSAPGTYQGFWQMSAPNGTFFGQTIWVGITVPGTQPTQASKPFIQNFAASPVNILSGQCTQLVWIVTGSISRIDLQRNGSLLWGGVPFTGNYSDCLAVAGIYTYVLTAVGPSGSTWAQAQVQVTSGQPPPPVNPVIYEFYANPSQLQIGQCTTLYWNTASGTSIQLFSNDVAIANNLPASGSQSNCPNRTGPLTYHLLVRNAAGEARASFNIYVDDSGASPQ
jgi:polar amino acid transport system substrate-binding protein